MIIIIFCGGLVFCLNYQHILINLIRIEFIILGLFFFTYIYLLLLKYELIFSIVLLTFIVREGVLGLSLLLGIVRAIGNNYFQSISLFK